MQGNDLKNIQEATQRARAALAGKNLVPGRAVQANNTQNDTDNVQAAPTQVPVAAPAQTQTPEAVQNLSEKLRAINKNELATVIGFLRTGSYSSAVSYLSEHNEIDLNDKDMLNKFDETINIYVDGVRNARLAWRAAPWELQNEMEQASREVNRFKRFLKNEHAKRAGTESAYRSLVTAFENLKEPTPKGQFLKELVNRLSFKQFNFAIELLQTHESKRFSISDFEMKCILSAIVVATERFHEEREDNVSFNNTVAASRHEEQIMTDFKESLKKFSVTLNQYKDGKPLTQFEAPSPYRYHNFDSRT